jgi:hypothetical protein
LSGLITQARNLYPCFVSACKSLSGIPLRSCKRGLAAARMLLQRNDPSVSIRGIAVNRTHLAHRGLISARNDKKSPSSIRDSALCGMGRIGVLIAACCLLSTAMGCMRLPIRHGMIVKGDWSLEMNRIPWMKGRDNVYQQPSECGTIQNMCATEVDSPFATSAMRIPSPLSTAHRCSNPGCGSAAHGESTVGYQAHARFHPVPTRSVFASEPSLAPAMNERTSPAALPPVRSVPKSLEPPPLPPETEVIPAPTPASPESPNDQAAVHRETGSRQVSWVFSTATAGSESVPDDDQRHVAVGAFQTVR